MWYILNVSYDINIYLSYDIHIISTSTYHMISTSTYHMISTKKIENRIFPIINLIKNFCRNILPNKIRNKSLSPVNYTFSLIIICITETTYPKYLELLICSRYSQHNIFQSNSLHTYKITQPYKSNWYW